MQSHLIVKKRQSPFSLCTARIAEESWPLFTAQVYFPLNTYYKSSFSLFSQLFSEAYSWPLLCLWCWLFPCHHLSLLLIFLSLSYRHPTAHKTMAVKTFPPTCLASALVLDSDMCWWLEGKLRQFKLSGPIMMLTVSYS